MVKEDDKDIIVDPVKWGKIREDLILKEKENKLSNIELDIISNQKGKEVVLNNVVFASNSSKIDSSSFEQLNELILYLLKNPDISLEIQGHTDNIGSNNDNLILSTQRAEVIYNYIRDKVSNRLEFKGYGELVPLFSNTSKENRFETYNEIKSGKNYRIIDFKDNYPVHNDNFKKKNDDLTIINENWGSIEIEFHKKVKLNQSDYKVKIIKS